MKFSTINRWLRRIGLVLVLVEDLDTHAHSLRLERAKRYDNRSKPQRRMTADEFDGKMVMLGVRTRS